MIERIFERGAICWKWLQKSLHDRPVQFFMYLTSSFTVAVILGWSLLATNENQSDINTVKLALCNSVGSPDMSLHQRKQCQELFDRLLKNPTPQQVKRLREIVKGK